MASFPLPVVTAFLMMTLTSQGVQTDSGESSTQVLGHNDGTIQCYACETTESGNEQDFSNALEKKLGHPNKPSGPKVPVCEDPAIKICLTGCSTTKATVSLNSVKWSFTRKDCAPKGGKGCGSPKEVEGADIEGETCSCENSLCNGAMSRIMVTSNKAMFFLTIIVNAAIPSMFF